jgi:hypothetical protein
MTGDHEPEHGDATLAVIALLEATLKDDGQGYDVLFASVLASDNLSHVLGNLIGILADHLASHHGRDGALEILAHQRGHELDPDECEDAEPSEHAQDHSHGHGETDGLDEVGYQLSELNEKTDAAARSLSDISVALDVIADQADGLIRLTDAVLRVGDILDKRLS